MIKIPLVLMTVLSLLLPGQLPLVADTGTIGVSLAGYPSADIVRADASDKNMRPEPISTAEVDSLMTALVSSHAGDRNLITPAYKGSNDVHMLSDAYQTKYIAEVFEYWPAPGQFINKEPLGHPLSAASITAGVNGIISLGAFGGHIIFRFEEPVVNHPDNPYGIDFILFGNALTDFSEPGIVSVMKDENGNGLPDDVWYELAGSDHFFSGTLWDSRVSYYNPGGDSASDVFWADEAGQHGYIYAKPFHQQPYYPGQALFPFVDAEMYTVSGTRIVGHTDLSDPMSIKSHQRAFGYADNRPRRSAPWHVPANPYSREVSNAGGDGFDIGWAVDSLAQYVNLDTIHFVKVHTGMLADAGVLGEISTEISGGAIVKPDPVAGGVLDMVVIRDLPAVITTKEMQLEALAFRKGRVQWDEEIHWSADLNGSHIDESGVIRFTEDGELSLTAYLAGNPAIFDVVTSRVKIQDDPTSVMETDHIRVLALPNPAKDYVQMTGANNATVTLFSMGGMRIRTWLDYSSGQSIFVGDLNPGIYILRVDAQYTISKLRLIIQ
jgi:hypothetical protein